MIAAADEPQQVVQITAIDDGGRTAAQTDGLHLAVGQVGGVGLELQRHGQHIPVQHFGVVAPARHREEKKKTDCVERTRCRQSKPCSGLILPGACGFGK